MRRAIVAAIALASATRAHASPLADEMKLAGAAEAPIVARIDPAALPQIHDAIRARVPFLLRGGFDRALAAIAQQLGGDPLTADGWRALGLDPARPIVIVAGLDTDLRAIVAIRDPALAAQTVARAQAIAPQLALARRGDLIAIDLSGRAEPPSTDAAIRARLRAAPALAGKAPIAIHVDPRFAPVPAALRPIVLGSFGALAVAIDLRDGAAIVHARWDVVPRSALAAALAVTVDDGLPRPTDTPDAILHVHTYFDLAALAAVPTRGMTFDLPARPFLADADAPAWIDALTWPYDLGATMAHVIGAVPRAKLVFAGLHDAALVVTSAGADLDHTDATIELAIEPAAAAILEPLADGVWGAHTTAGDDALWGSGRVRAFARTLATSTVGLAVQGSAPLYLAIARKAPPAPRGLVLEVHAAPDALALLDPIAYFAGTLDLAARYDGHALAIEATLSP